MFAVISQPQLVKKQAAAFEDIFKRKISTLEKLVASSYAISVTSVIMKMKFLIKLNELVPIIVTSPFPAFKKRISVDKYGGM